MAADQPYRLFLPCAPGLEPWLLAEVRAVGGIRPRTVAGGVEIEANEHVLDRCLLEVGLALDVRLRLAELPAPGFDAVVRRTRSLPWLDFVGPGQAVEVRATARRSRLHHTGAIAERVREGIQGAVGSLASDSEGVGPWRVFARMEDDRLTLSLSLAGEPLSRRGYRLASAKAPLREDLARAVLVMSGWTPEHALVDPFCGSGTLAVEAALLATRTPPGWGRAFHWTRAPTFDRARWDRIRAQLEAGRRAAPAPILASDRDAGAVEAARANAERAGVSDAVRLAVAALGKAPFPDRELGWWISNPPYGGRIGRGSDLRDLYQAIGQRFAQLGSGWRLGLLVDAPKWAHLTGVELESQVLLDHGGRKVRFHLSPPRGRPAT